ncbi:hypothetical protein ACIQU5_07700 [Streptomyces sp. NPDC090306]|uniref:hypothetical protein n=1 Tax=unclassified Streptomyces TaxID=2593676 RepID=UPI0036E52F09
MTKQRSRGRRRARALRRRAGAPRRRSDGPAAEPVRRRRSRRGLVVFWAVSVLGWAGLVAWPASAGEWMLTWIAALAAPAVIAFAYACVYPDVRGTQSDPFGGTWGD